MPQQFFDDFCLYIAKEIKREENQNKSFENSKKDV